MVSCGSCSKWQHITCHDSADRRMGRPKRNWEEGQFYCSRCRQKMSGASSYNGPHVIPYAVGQQPSSWSQGAAADSMLHLQKAASQYHNPYAQSTSDPRYHPQNGIAHNQPHAPAVPYSHPPPYQAALTFAHYQPELRGFLTSRSAHRPQNAPPASPHSPQAPPNSWNNNGYWSDTSRTTHITPYAAQYTNGAYASNRTTYQVSIFSAKQLAESAEMMVCPAEHACTTTQPVWTWPGSCFYFTLGSCITSQLELSST